MADDAADGRVAPFAGRVVAVEAGWDGDTVHDWFVVLLAVLDDPSEERGLAIVYQRRDVPSPAGPAAEAGRAPADHLGVPFHFASPGVPDDHAPRWRDVGAAVAPRLSRWGRQFTDE
ncbi:hypothetical protein [Streptodolium elevatio]